MVLACTLGPILKQYQSPSTKSGCLSYGNGSWSRSLYSSPRITAFLAQCKTGVPWVVGRSTYNFVMRRCLLWAVFKYLSSCWLQREDFNRQKHFSFSFYFQFLSPTWLLHSVDSGPAVLASKMTPYFWFDVTSSYFWSSLLERVAFLQYVMADFCTAHPRKMYREQIISQCIYRFAIAKAICMKRANCCGPISFYSL